MHSIEFAHPQFLWLYALIPLYALWYYYKGRHQEVRFRLPSASLFKKHQSWKNHLQKILVLLKIVAFGFLVFAMARPRTHELSERTFGDEGIDIVLAMDISGSMQAEDFKPNRMEASKEVALNFIKSRPTDRIGLVVYSGESFTQCPLTLDHSIAKNLLQDVNIGMIEDQSTAIGVGLATSVNRLKESKAESKVVILLTDGVNNSGFIDPQTAAEIAKQFKIRVYTIGVGTYGKAPYPFDTPFGKQYKNIEVNIDEEVLSQVAETTGGKYFRADSKKALKSIYKEIDEMEKTELESIAYQRYEELFYQYLLIGFVLLSLEYLLRLTYFKSRIA